MSHRVVRMGVGITLRNAYFVERVQEELAYRLGTTDVELWWTANHPASVVVSDDEFSYNDDEYLRDMFFEALGDVEQDTEVVVDCEWPRASIVGRSTREGNEQ